MKHKRKRGPSVVRDYIRSSFFGIEDSLVSTTGLIAGVAVATTDREFIIVAALVAIAVEAISMSAGEFLSEEAERDLGGGKRVNPVIGGLIMLVSYTAAGFIPLLPVLLLPHQYALTASIASAFVGLFGLGYVRGSITGKSRWRNAVKVLVVGGIAALMGIAVGVFFKPPGM